MSNDSLPVEYLNGEFGLAFSSTFINSEKTLCKALCNLSEDFKDNYKDKVVLVNAIPVEKQIEFIECFKTNDKDTINNTLEIIMNDYSKDKIEFLNQSTTVIDDTFDHDNINMLLSNHFNRLPETKYHDMKMYGKPRNHTIKHQPDKKSKKSARRNNRRAKRNNR